MRTREKIRIYKKFMKGASVMEIAKEYRKRADYYSNDWSPWKFTLCLNEVEQAIRDVATDTILFHESRAK